MLEEVRARDHLEKIEALLNNKDYRALKNELAEAYPMDLAEIMEELSPEECLLLFRLLHKDQAAEVFSYLEAPLRKQIATAINSDLLEHILNELYFDDKIDFLEDMPTNFVKSLIANAPDRGLINQFLQYPDNSAGSLMTIEYVDLRKNMTVRDALRRIKQTGTDKETIYTCYVLDNTHKLEGIVSLRSLVLAGEEEAIATLMHDDIIIARVDDDQEQVAEDFKKYDLMAIPVVDGEERLVGIITIDDIVDVIERENTEDFHKMAAMAPSDEAYLDTGVFALAKHRILWLLVLMISATFTGGIITYYEGLLSSVVVLTASIPMLMDSGGNAGSQSSTLIIRGIALGEITLADYMRVMWKEFRVGLVAGGALGIVNLLRMYLIGQGGGVALTVSATLAVTVMVAKLVGGVLPIAAKSLKMDPAIMAGPLITTIVDALSLFIYFSIAKVILF